MKKRVAVVGATGVAGQQFLVALENHPWFEVVALAASSRSAGRQYSEAIRDPQSGARRWWCVEEPPDAFMDLVVQDAADLDPDGIDLFFCAVETDAARGIESRLARTTPIVSTASAFRYEDDVPILVPGINFGQTGLLAQQRQSRGWAGFVVPVPNCTTMGLVVTLKPLFDAFGLRHVIMTSMQGISGAGRSPGVLAMDIIDNIIPYIPKEEEKVARETAKILGRFVDGRIEPASFPISATCTRAPVLEAHTETVHLATERPASPEAAAAVLREYGTGSKTAELPSAPRQMIVVHDDPYRPQPRLDRNRDNGMATSVGRLRPDPAFENGLKYVLVSHNTKMGAARGAVLVAEELVSAGFV